MKMAPCLLLLCFFTCSPLQAEPLHVVLDPGHGGHDKGATRGTCKEAHIVLNLARHLKKKLERDKRFKVTLTRNSDQFVSLRQRALIANNAQADLFLSIHANASPDHRAKGLEIYFQNQLAPDEESMFLANLESEGHSDDRISDRDELQGIEGVGHLKGDLRHIVEDLIRNQRVIESGILSRKIKEFWRGTTKSKRHSIRQAPFFVVSNVNMPSSLVEIGFVSNPREAKRLIRKDYQKLLAQSLYDSLIDYKESMDK